MYISIYVCAHVFWININISLKRHGIMFTIEFMLEKSHWVLVGWLEVSSGSQAWQWKIIHLQTMTFAAANNSICLGFPIATLDCQRVNPVEQSIQYALSSMIHQY